MRNKLFMGLMAMTVSLPVIVAPVHAQEVKTEVSQDFIDVPKTHSAYKEIKAMREQGIISGYLDNTFKPAQSISRIHVASLLVRSLDLPSVRVGKEFKDVPKTSPYYEAVQKVYRAGIFDGNTNGTFGINDNLTRAQMAKVMVKAFDLDIHKGYIFSDISADHWAKDYISSLYINGITVGSNGKYMPNDPVSRAHYATFLFRALNPEEAPKPAKPLQTEPPKPVTTEVKKPNPKPEPPKPPVVNREPKLPVIMPGNPFPSGPIEVPAGWTESKTKEHDKVIEDTVFQYAPKKGTITSFGTSTYTLDLFNDPEFRAGMARELLAIQSSVTIDEWYNGVNQAIKTGDVYIAPDYSFGVYIHYYKSMAFIKFTH